jgi:hypothetical protein
MKDNDPRYASVTGNKCMRYGRSGILLVSACVHHLVDDYYHSHPFTHGGRRVRSVFAMRLRRSSNPATLPRVRGAYTGGTASEVGATAERMAGESDRAAPRGCGGIAANSVHHRRQLSCESALRSSLRARRSGACSKPARSSRSDSNQKRNGRLQVDCVVGRFCTSQGDSAATLASRGESGSIQRRFGVRRFVFFSVQK